MRNYHYSANFSRVFFPRSLGGKKRLWCHPSDEAVNTITLISFRLPDLARQKFRLTRENYSRSTFFGDYLR